MKQKDKDALRNLSVSELKAELGKAREQRFTLEFKHSSTPVANPMEIRNLRRKIAMIETFLKEKAMAAATAGAKKN